MKEDGRSTNYPFRLKVDQRAKVDELAAQAGIRPYEVVDQMIEYALTRARIGMVTRPGLVFDVKGGEKND